MFKATNQGFCLFGLCIELIKGLVWNNTFAKMSKKGNL